VGGRGMEGTRGGVVVAILGTCTLSDRCSFISSSHAILIRYLSLHSVTGPLHSVVIFIV
jgi:hypothetical protein